MTTATCKTCVRRQRDGVALTDLGCVCGAMPVLDDADLDVEAMFPTPAAARTARFSRDARVAHTTNKRSW